MSDPLEFEITDNERRHLQAMLKSPGFLVLEKIHAAYLDAVEQNAKSVSKTDPLSNPLAVANRWAYVMMGEEWMRAMKAGVAFEIEMLTASERPAADPADLAQRRRLHASFGALDPIPER